MGRSEGELRKEFGTALQPAKIELRQGPSSLIAIAQTEPGAAETQPENAPSPAPAATAKDPFVDQQRLVLRPETKDVALVEFELFRDRVYRVRWTLAERFERPFMPVLVDHSSADFGDPYYDQTIEGKFGTGRATMRRSAWRDGDRSLEIRQLNPMIGGPIFITLSDLHSAREIVASGGTAAPEPDSIGPWWQKPVKSVAPVTQQERDALLAAFDVVLAQVGWGH